MAINIDKAVNPAPLGDEEMSMEGPIEIEIVSDEDMEALANMDFEESEGPFDENLAELMEEDSLRALSMELVEVYDDDVNARSEWIQTYIDGLELLGMTFEDRTEPWDGACGVYHPLLAEALVKFQAETMMATFPAAGPVRTKIIGEETPEKVDAAKRVQEDMNFEITEKMPEYRPEHERMLWGLGASGNAFKKVYFDPTRNRQCSMYVAAEDLVVPYGDSDIQTASRITHVMRKTEHELAALIDSGFYRDTDLPEPRSSFDEVEKAIAEKMGFRAEQDDRYKLLEMHVNMVLEGIDSDGDLAKPYIITIEKDSGDILSIYRNWREDDDRHHKRNYFVHYQYIPGFGFYAFGLIHLIGAFAKSGTSIIRQLVDAGTLSNLPGGFKTKGFRTKNENEPIGPGEFRDADIASGTLKDNILPLPYKEPSAVLYQLLQTIVEEGRRFASAADMKVSDMSSQSPVGTTLAILERSLKVMSAVQARIHYSMKQEFRLLKQIIRDYGSDEYSYDPTVGEQFDKKADYDSVDVIPVSDPNQATMAQKVVQYQAVLQLSQSAPHLYDLPRLHRDMLDVLGIKNAEKLVPLEDDMKPQEPVAENMNIINGKPVRAHLYQDHESHIVVHTSAMQDPEIMKLVGQSPQAQAIGAAMEAHIAEHLAFAYRKQIEDAAGVPYPGPEDEMDEQTELQVSRLAAAAAEQVLNKNKTKQAAEQAQIAAQDPIVQMQLQELGIKDKEAQAKVLKVITDAAAKRDELASKERIAGMEIGVEIAKAKADEQRSGMEMGIDVARTAREQYQRAKELQTKKTGDK